MHRAKKKEQKLRAAIAELDGTASSGTDSDPVWSQSSESTSTDQNHSDPAPMRPRVNAGMDRSAILDHCTRLSQVPSEFDSSSLEPLGVTLCSVAQFGRAIHLVSRHCALCPGAIPQIEVGTRIYADEQFWDEHLPKINRIYCNALLPEFACPRRPQAPVRGYRLDKGREMIVNGSVEWASEWKVDSEKGLIQTE